MKVPEIKFRKGKPFYFLASFEKKEDAKKHLRKFVNAQRAVGYKKAFCFDLSNKFSKQCYGLYVERLSLLDKGFFHNVICYGTN